MARIRSQQVKVSEQDRALIVALAELDGMTPSTWCYHVIMNAVESQRDRLAGRKLRLVGPNEGHAAATPAPGACTSQALEALDPVYSEA